MSRSSHPVERFELRHHVGGWLRHGDEHDRPAVDFVAAAADGAFFFFHVFFAGLLVVVVFDVDKTDQVVVDCHHAEHPVHLPVGKLGFQETCVRGCVG